MKKDRLPLVVLAAALAALLGTGAWAAVTATQSSSTAGYYGAMRADGMMSYAPGDKAHRVSGLAEAKRLGQGFADRLGLKADEVLQFERNYYVRLIDDKGRGATEVLVDPQTGAVSLEYGPAMMWNNRYGMHGQNRRQMMGSYGAGMMGGGMMGTTSGGMMGGYATGPTTASSVSEDAARAIAQRWLTANRAGLKVESGGDAFPGYYTFEVLNRSKIGGMLSVNASGGAVIYHWWHGGFVAELAA